MLEHYKQSAPYEPWLPDIISANHMCITSEGYVYLKPTTEELSAFKLVYGKDMEYPKPDKIIKHA